MQSVKLSITYQHALATMVIQEILSDSATLFHSIVSSVTIHCNYYIQVLFTTLAKLYYFIIAEEVQPKDVCFPSPCGANSKCREVNGQAVCSCLEKYIGTPPACRPECVVSSECSQNKACINQKCTDPCPGTCGLNARCEAINHSPICSCQTGYTGEPFTRCFLIPGNTISF